MRCPPTRLVLSSLALLLACGGSARREPATRAPRAAAAGPADAVDVDARIIEAIYVESIRPVEATMCRRKVPASRCAEVCGGAHDLRDAAMRICSAGDRDPAVERKCSESRSLVRRADTACAFCSGRMTRRPCADVF